MFHDSPNNLCFSGREPGKKTPRLFEPIDTDFLCKSEAYICGKCGATGGAGKFWTATVCLSCWKGEGKCTESKSGKSERGAKSAEHAFKPGDKCVVKESAATWDNLGSARRLIGKTVTVKCRQWPNEGWIVEEGYWFRDCDLSPLPSKGETEPSKEEGWEPAQIYTSGFSGKWTHPKAATCILREDDGTWWHMSEHYSSYALLKAAMKEMK